MYLIKNNGKNQFLFFLIYFFSKRVEIVIRTIFDNSHGGEYWPGVIIGKFLVRPVNFSYCVSVPRALPIASLLVDVSNALLRLMDVTFTHIKQSTRKRSPYRAVDNLYTRNVRQLRLLVTDAARELHASVYGFILWRIRGQKRRHETDSIVSRVSPTCRTFREQQPRISTN